MEITNVSNEFIKDVDISDDGITFAGVTLSPNNYEGRIRDIMILLGRGMQIGEPLIREENSH